MSDAQRLRDLQTRIDDIDGKVIELLRARFSCSREIGGIKRAAGGPPYDPARVAAQTEQFVVAAAAAGLEPTMARQLICAVVAQVLVERLTAAPDAGAVTAAHAEASKKRTP